jgi:hypothetical protein
MHRFAQISLANLIERDAILGVHLIEFDHSIPTSRDKEHITLEVE